MRKLQHRSTEHGLQQTNFLPPNIASFRKHGGLDNFWSHPCVSPCCTHFGCSVPLSSQTKVCNLQSFITNVIMFHLL